MPEFWGDLATVNARVRVALPGDLHALALTACHGQEDVGEGDRLVCRACLLLPANHNRFLVEALRFGARVKLLGAPLTFDWGSDTKGGYRRGAVLVPADTWVAALRAGEDALREAVRTLTAALETRLGYLRSEGEEYWLARALLPKGWEDGA